MSERAKQRINRLGLLRSNGWRVNHNDRNMVKSHSGSETLRHFLVKSAVCRQISENGHTFLTEVGHKDRGVVDVLDLHESGPKSYVYEIETGCTRERHLEKVAQYTNGGTCDEIADVFVIDPTEAPDRWDELREWVAGKVVG